MHHLTEATGRPLPSPAEAFRVHLISDILFSHHQDESAPAQEQQWCILNMHFTHSRAQQFLAFSWRLKRQFRMDSGGESARSRVQK